MRLEQDLRFNLLGQLSEEKTTVDVNIASKIARRFAVSFTAFFAEHCFELFDSKTYYIRDHEHYNDAYSIEDILYLWENELL